MSSEKATSREEQPTRSRILQAVHKCTASVNTVKDRLGSLTEEVALLRQDLQRISERTTAVESRISDLEDKLLPLIAESRSTAWMSHEKVKQMT